MRTTEEVVRDITKLVIDSAQSIGNSTNPQRVYDRNKERLKNLVAIHGKGVAYTTPYIAAENAHTASIVTTNIFY